MIEVFKTNVIEKFHAEKLVNEIQSKFISYKVNFDLEDCDKILRVKSVMEPIQAHLVIRLVNNLGFEAEVLPDEIPLLHQSYSFS